MKKERPALPLYYGGEEACAPNHFFGPATRQHYLLHVVLRGCGTYQVEKKTFFVKAGEAFLIRPHEVTYYQADKETPWSYAWVAFDGAEAERLLRARGLLDDGQYICRFADALCAAREIHLLIEALWANRHDAAAGHFYLLLSEIAAPQSGTQPLPLFSYYQTALRYIHHNYGYHIQITDIARHVGVDRTYLYKIFMAQAGLSPKGYLTRYRIQAAKEMLQNTQLSITEIALSCGFSDSSLFCRHFLRAVGCSPGTYRSQS